MKKESKVKKNNTILKLTEGIKFGRGIIRSKKNAEGYINFGYSPSRLLLHYDIVNDEALQYILAEIAREKSKLN